VLGSSAPELPVACEGSEEPSTDEPSGAEAVVLVEGGVVWVGAVVVVAGVEPSGVDDGLVVVGEAEVVVPWGVDVDGAVVVELNVGLVVVWAVEVLGVVSGVLVDGVVVVSRQWSSFPFELPWSSHSRPFVFGSVRHGAVLFPWEQLSPGDPGGAGGLSELAAEA
jgi:hypothetical protein